MISDVRHPNTAQDFKDEDIVEIVVTFVKSSTEFYGIDQRMLTDIQRLQDEMDTWYSQNHNTFEFFYVPRIETFCAAIVQNHWRRAKVICHKNGGCEAYLLDSGETVRLDLPSLRWLEDHFIQFPAGASHFTLLKSALDRKLMNNTNESKHVCVKIQSISYRAFPTTYAVTLLAQMPDHREICSIESSLSDMGTSANESMHKDVHTNSFECSQGTESQQIIKITHCVSPGEFYSHFESEREKLIQLQNELQSLNANPQHRPKLRWTVGKKCYVRTKMTGVPRECWYRGEIRKSSDRNWDVFLRDYGNVVSIKSPENLVSQNEHFEKLKNAAVKCSLAFIAPVNGSGWSTEAAKKFHELYCKYERLTVTLPQHETESTSLPVILWGLTKSKSKWTNLNINKELVREEFAQLTVGLPALDVNSAKCLERIKKVAAMIEVECPKLNSWIPAKPTSQSSFTCIPSCVSDELIIYFHDIEAEDNLKSMRRDAKRKFRNYENTEELQWATNELCMAKYIDGTYYRGMILTVIDQTAEVLQYFYKSNALNTVNTLFVGNEFLHYIFNY